MGDLRFRQAQQERQETALILDNIVKILNTTVEVQAMVNTPEFVIIEKDDVTHMVNMKFVEHVYIKEGNENEAPYICFHQISGGKVEASGEQAKELISQIKDPYEGEEE